MKIGDYLDRVIEVRAWGEFKKRHNLTFCELQNKKHCRLMRQTLSYQLIKLQVAGGILWLEIKAAAVWCNKQKKKD